MLENEVKNNVYGWMKIQRVVQDPFDPRKDYLPLVARILRLYRLSLSHRQLYVHDEEVLLHVLKTHPSSLYSRVWYHIRSHTREKSGGHRWLSSIKPLVGDLGLPKRHPIVPLSFVCLCHVCLSVCLYHYVPPFACIMPGPTVFVYHLCPFVCL